MKNALAIVLLLFCFSYGADLNWRTFNSGNNVWFVSPTQLFCFSPDTRTALPVSIDPKREISTITDVTENEGFLWISTNGGVYQIDMRTQSVERISFSGDVIKMGEIAVDIDYFWLFSGDTLYRFDKLAREWTDFPLPFETMAAPVGIHSDGEELFCIGKDVLYKFTISTEKWNTYQQNLHFSDSAQIISSTGSFFLIDGNRFGRFQQSLLSWDKIDYQGQINDYIVDGSTIYSAVGNKVYKSAMESGLIRPLEIPDLGKIYAVSKLSGIMAVATANRIVQFDLVNSTLNFVEYPQGPDISKLEFLINNKGFFIAVYPRVIAIYDKENRVWHLIPKDEKTQGMKNFSWDNDGLVLRYTEDFQSALKGKIQSITKLRTDGMVYDTSYGINGREIDSTILLRLSLPNAVADLNLHTSDPQDRIADITFNNVSVTNPAVKEVYYRGNPDDRFNNLQLGTTGNDQLSSPLMPKAQFEGGSFVVESRERLEARDRKVLKAGGGSGWVTTRTEWKVLPYRSNGKYQLLSSDDLSDSSFSLSSQLPKDSIRILPGSVRLIVDGEVLDSTEYSFDSEAGNIELKRLAPVDPFSSITVSYKVQVLPKDGIDAIEFKPTRHFGRLHFGNVTLSPQEWISARIGFTGIDEEDFSPLVSIASPLEIRGKKTDVLVKSTPEFVYDMENGSRAGSISLQSRIGKNTGLVFNGMIVDTGFYSTDSLTRGLGKIKNEYDLSFSHDLVQEMPLGYYQHRRFSADGEEKRFAASSGLRFPGFPYLDVTAARTNIEIFGNDDTIQAAIDSLYTVKDKVRFKLYETSSLILEDLTRFKKISYDVSFSEYRTQFSNSETRHPGRMAGASVTVMPVQPVLVDLSMTHKNSLSLPVNPSVENHPKLEVHTVDAPMGADIDAVYDVIYHTFPSQGITTDTISREISVVLKPSQWFSPLRWFSPRGKIKQVVNCRVNTVDPSLLETFTGLKSGVSSMWTRSAGVNILPNDAVFFYNNNDWVESGISRSFQTNNDLQIWLGPRNYLQGKWEYLTDFQNISQNGSLNYDRVWAAWLRSTSGIKAQYLLDSIGITISAGPRLVLNLNFQDLKFLKFLQNTNELSVEWMQTNGVIEPIPLISCFFSLRLVVQPNLQLSSQTGFKFKSGFFDSIWSRVVLTSLF